MKRTVIILLVLIALLVLVMVGALLFAGRDIAPPNTSDLVPDRPEVADVDNAFTYFTEAIAAADWPEADELLYEILDDKKSDPAYVADLLSRNRETLELIERGLACHICQCPEVRTIAESSDYLQYWRRLSNLLVLRVRHDREAGRWADATIRCCQLLRMGNLVHKDAVSTLHSFVGIAMFGQGFALAHDLAASADMPKDELDQLSETLTQLGPLDRGLAQAAKGEYQIMANESDNLWQDSQLGGAAGAGNHPSSLRPYYLLQPNKTRQMLANCQRNLIKNAAIPATERMLIDVEALTGYKDNRAAFVLAPNPIGRMLVALLVPSRDTFLAAHTRVQSELAAIRLVVACRRYEIDHGELPPALDALVSDYLDAVPSDPFDGKPFRYDRERAVVYSIGADLIDGGGSQRPLSDTLNLDGTPYRWAAEDAVFPIHGQPKPPPQP